MLASNPRTAGIDSHKDTLTACVIDQTGRQIASRTFPNTEAGHAQTAVWLTEHQTTRVGIEGAGSYGRRLAVALQNRGTNVVEVPPQIDRPRTQTATHPPENRPHRRARHRPRRPPRGQPAPAPPARPNREPTSPSGLPAGTRRFQNSRHQPPPRRPHPTAAQPASTNSQHQASLPPKPSNG